jgi:hypothetical protein
LSGDLDVATDLAVVADEALRLVAGSGIMIIMHLVEMTLDPDRRGMITLRRISIRLP